MRTIALVGALLVATAFMAGCVGEVELKQTEPIRIQIDGGSQQGRVTSADDCDDPCSTPDTQEFEIETKEVEKVTVVVMVTRISSGSSSTTTTTAADNETREESGDPCEVLVQVKDRSSGTTIQEKTVSVTDDSAEANLDIDVKGKNNIVIVTQAVKGVADVDVSAQTSSSSSGDQNMGTDSPSPTTGTTSASPTTSTSPTSTSKP